VSNQVKNRLIEIDIHVGPKNSADTAAPEFVTQAINNYYCKKIL